MKLFLDTNVFVEFIEHRKQYEPVSLITFARTSDIYTNHPFRVLFHSATLFIYARHIIPPLDLPADSGECF